MDRIVFGDNQFFGINHMSEEKARAQAMKFRDIGAILRVVDAAYSCGIHTFMFTTHEVMGQICDHFRANKSRYPQLKLLPAMPYAHKYANAVAEKGIVPALSDAISGHAFSAFAAGAKTLMTQNPVGLTKVLVDTEMKMFAGLDTPVIFLQNIVNDLLLGLRLSEAVAVFADHVRKKYDAAPGFITMNLPATAAWLREAGVVDPVICSPINSLGYLMSPDRAGCEEALRKGGFRALAMSIFASGAIAPQDAVEYVTRLPGVESIVFGASGRSNIEQTKGLIDAAWGQAR